MQSLRAEKESAAELTSGDKRRMLSERMLTFAANAIKFTYGFPSTDAGKHIGKQLIRSATSIGANYEEGCAAESRADFIHKLQISFKEAKETVYWLRLSEKLELADGKKSMSILQEGNELQLILAKSIATTKGVAT